MRQKYSATVKYCMLAAVLTMVAGCENPYVKQLKDEFGWTEDRMLRDGWLKSYAIAQPPVYCYRTLADVDCYSKPKRQHRDRLIKAPYEGDY